MSMGLFCGIQIINEAVHYPAYGLSTLFCQDFDDISPGFATVNDKWFIDLPGCPDVDAKPLPLPIEVSLASEIIQSCFSDGDHRWIVCQLQQVLFR